MPSDVLGGSAEEFNDILDVMLERFSALRLKHHVSSENDVSPLASIGSLDDKIDLISYSLKTITAIGIDRAARLRYQRNALVPIHRLPVELIRIFENLIEWNNYILHRATHTLAQVCKSWAEILTRWPTIWSAIDFNRGIASVTQSLRLSANHPLAIKFITPGKGQLKAGFASAFSLACQHIYRWETVTLYILSDAFAVLENSKAPILRYLRLQSIEISRGEEDGFSVPVLDLFQGHAPRLTKVALLGVALKDWNSSLLRNLQSLTLSHLGSSAPSLHQILNSIRSSIKLESLDIAGIHTYGDPQKMDPIHLPDLRKIAIRESSPVCAATILDTTRTPNCEHYTIGYGEGDMALQDALRRCMRRVTQMATTKRGGPMLVKPSELDVSFYQNAGNGWYDPTPSSPTFTVDVEGAPHWVVTSWIMDVLDEGEVTTDLELEIDDWVEFDLEVVEYQRLLGSLPSLHRIDASGMDYGLETILKALSVPDLQSGSEGWPCPELITFSIDCCHLSSPASLLEMVEGRIAASLSKGLHVPKRLERIEVDGVESMTTRIWARMMEALGPNAICDWKNRGGESTDDDQGMEVEGEDRASTA
ncbi:hypothetical protein FRB96_002977 [Tulasnella sp. 330]|nr:hypothetical protein FRB96_002977 [Tulasnella sp. 330]